MKQNAAMRGMLRRFQEILDAFDDYDELEELNAEFEDAIFFMESIDDEADDVEEIADALDEIDALCADYRAACRDDGMRQIALEMEIATQMARRNLIT